VSSPRPDWYEISHEAMDKLREEDRYTYNHSMQQVGHTAQFDGYPIHLQDGKWYVEVPPNGNTSYQKAYLDQQLRIEEVVVNKGPGTYIPSYSKDLFRVYDGERWIDVPSRVIAELAIHGISYAQNGHFSPEELRRIKDFVAEEEDEVERLALRQLLAESQDDDG
jgi:hypothetical protein